jgi:hypothetical protein
MAASQSGVLDLCSSEENGLSVEAGVIRGGQAQVIVWVPELRSLQLVAFGPVRQELGRQALTEQPPEPGSVQIDVPSGLRRLAATLDLRPMPGPIITVELQDGDGSAMAELGENYQLGELGFESYEAFKSSAIARRALKRPRDKETQMFQARQMVVHFPKVREDKITELALTMASTQAYRACEMGQPEAARDAIAMVDDILAAVDSLPRNNRNEYARVSLLTAKWHAATAAQDVDGFDASLSELMARHEEIAANDLAFTLQYNTVRSICTLAIYRLVQGRVPEAESCLDAIVPVMAGAGARFSSHPAHIREFARTCRLVQPIEYVREVIRERSRLPLLDRPIATLRKKTVATVLVDLLRSSIRTSNEDVVADTIFEWGKQYAVPR